MWSGEQQQRQHFACAHVVCHNVAAHRGPLSSTTVERLVHFHKRESHCRSQVSLPQAGSVVRAFTSPLCAAPRSCPHSSYRLLCRNRHLLITYTTTITIIIITTISSIVVGVVIVALPRTLSNSICNLLPTPSPAIVAPLTL